MEGIWLCALVGAGTIVTFQKALAEDKTLKKITTEAQYVQLQLEKVLCLESPVLL